MKLKIIVIVLAAILAGGVLTACGAETPRDTLVQVSTIDAILNGLYDGVMTAGELKGYGDFGIGTFAGLDGEMIELEGRIYQVKADGVA